MVDFSVEGALNAVDNVSDKVNDISESLLGAAGSGEEAADGVDDASVAFSELAGVASAADEPLDDVEDELEQINDELNQTVAGATAATGSITGLSAALRSIHDIDSDAIGPNLSADDMIGENISEFMRSDFAEMNPRQIFGSERGRRSFIDSLRQSSGGLSDTDEAFGLAEIGGVLDGDTRSIREFTESLDDATSEAVDTRDVMWSLRRATDAVSDEADNIDIEGAESIDDIRPIRAESEGIIQRERTGSVTAPLKSIEDSAEEAEDETSKLNRSLLAITPNAFSASTSLGFLDLALNNTEEGAEEASDEIQELNRSLRSLAPALRSVSANIGPFNIGLTNMATTIPSIIAVVTPLIAVLGGLITVLGAAVVALGAFMAVGAIQFLDELQSSFAGVEDTMGAVEALGRGLQQALWEAVEPLRSVQFGGMSGIELFVRLLQDLVLFVNNVAEAFAVLLSMDEMESFFFRIESALLTSSEAGDDATSMIEALQTGIREMLPYVTDFVVWFINAIPGFIEFASTISSELVPVLSEFGQNLIDVSARLARAGSSLMTVLLPAIMVFLQTISILVSSVQTLYNEFGILSESVSVFAVSAIGASTLILKLASAIQTLGHVAMGVDVILKSTIGATLLPLVIAIASVATGVYILEKRFGIFSDVASTTDSTLGPLVETLYETAQAIASILPRPVVDALYALTGVLMIAIPLLWAFNVAGLGTAGMLWSQVVGFFALSGAMVSSYIPATILSTKVSAALGAVLWATGIPALIMMASASIYAVTHMNQMVDIINNIIDSVLNLSNTAKLLLAPFIGVLAPIIAQLLIIREMMKFIMDPGGYVTGWADSIVDGLQWMLGTIENMFNWIGQMLEQILNAVKDASSVFDPRNSNFLGIDSIAGGAESLSRGAVGVGSNGSGGGSTNITVEVQNDRRSENSTKENKSFGNDVARVIANHITVGL